MKKKRKEGYKEKMRMNDSFYDEIYSSVHNT